MWEYIVVFPISYFWCFWSHHSISNLTGVQNGGHISIYIGIASCFLPDKANNINIKEFHGIDACDTRTPWLMPPAARVTIGRRVWIFFQGEDLLSDQVNIGQYRSSIGPRDYSFAALQGFEGGSSDEWIGKCLCWSPCSLLCTALGGHDTTWAEY